MRQKVRIEKYKRGRRKKRESEDERERAERKEIITREIVNKKKVFEFTNLTTVISKLDRKSTRLNSSHCVTSRMPSSA